METGQRTFGLIKTLMDAHTMGIHAAADLLRSCECRVFVADKSIEEALEKIESEYAQRLLLTWIREHKINCLGISFRLDPDRAVNIVGKTVYLLKQNGLYECDHALVDTIYFAGLLPACEKISAEYHGRIKTLCGGESAEETLTAMGLLLEEIPQTIISGCQYDKLLLQFGHEIIQKKQYVYQKPLERNRYPEYGTEKDSFLKRLDANFADGFQPLIRAHAGPYSEMITREECICEYCEWCKKLSQTGYLDILSIGSSQLSQSNFGEDWTNKVNGGGVPVNSEEEFHRIWLSARPMLVRTYSATKNIREIARMYQRAINISWHALSFWWFDELDGRGPNTLLRNLEEHIETIRDISLTNYPVEANVPHHFAFRGCDDVTYIVSAYLAARVTKNCGVRTFILQNMLNTPRSTWGPEDLAKSRAMLELVKSLQDDNFQVFLQTRAGLDYFRPDIHEAKAQLAAVTALMDDIEPFNEKSPQIIHVVSYCEALFLATPDLIDDSIKITRTALYEYRKRKKDGLLYDVLSDKIKERTQELLLSAQILIHQMEQYIPNLYSPKGLYLAFVAGWLPVPGLWSVSPEFELARNWSTQNIQGGICLAENGKALSLDARIGRCVKNMSEAFYILKQKYGEGAM